MLGPRARLPIFSGRASLLTRMPLSSAARVYVCTLVLQACLSFLLMPPAYVSAYSVLTLLFIAVLSLTLLFTYPLVTCQLYRILYPCLVPIFISLFVTRVQ